MKDTRLIITLLAFCTIIACSKETGTVSNTPAPQGTGNAANAGYGFFGRSNARLSGSNYSQSIPLDTANSMIKSYLSSVNYPYADTALRALTFDADTLRAYLQNPKIVSIKFILAHQPAYKNSGGDGLYSGMKPQALTMIVVGVDEAEKYVLNNRNGVYEHMSPCPVQCGTIASPYIQ